MVAGVKEILIPIKPQDVTIEKVMSYFPYVLEQFKVNAIKIRENYDFYCLNHDIWSKVRPHNDEKDINNKILEPHISSMIDWKTGYILGNPLKYAQSETKQIDDIKYINKYIRNSKKRAVDAEVATWAYATGVGYYFIEPKREDINIEYESPFDIYMREADTCCKVKSSYNGHKPLFDFLYTTVNVIENNHKKTYDIIDIYLPNHFYEYKADSSKKFTLINESPRILYTKLPLVEKRLHNGIGIVEKLRPIQNALDIISSGCLDNLQEVVNVIYKYKGIDMGDTPAECSDFHRTVKKNGAIQIPPNSNGAEYDLEILQTKALELQDVEKFRNELKRTAYETAGVPLSTSDTNSGGTTKSGSEVANGYDNAYNRALFDINDFISADYELLEKMLFICKQTPGNKINNLEASEVEIKYCLNLSDNILTKAQALSYFIDRGMPKGMALEKAKLSSDSEAEGTLWENAQQSTETEIETQTAAMPLI